MTPMSTFASRHARCKSIDKEVDCTFGDQTSDTPAGTISLGVKQPALRYANCGQFLDFQPHTDRQSAGWRLPIVSPQRSEHPVAC
jgi:hypothetical protein